MEHPLYILWYGPKHKIKYFWRNRVMKIWFRLRRGFWPDECWNLDKTFAKFLIPRLEYFRKTTCGYPASLEFYNSDDGPKKWDKILRRIIWSINWNSKDTDTEGWWSNRYCRNEQYRKRIDTRYKEGMRLFAEYYVDLWD